MKRIDRRRVKTITEQATRNALKKQQLNEWGRVGSLIGKAATGLWNGGKNFFRGSGAGLGGRMGRSLGFGWKDAMKNAGKLQKQITSSNPAFLPAGTIGNFEKANALAQRLAANSARTKGLGLGLLGGGALVASMAGGRGGTTPQPSGMPGETTNPYADYYNGGYADPYAGYYSGGYADPYAGYYTDPYATYYGGYDPYAAYYSSGYSTPSTGGGFSSNNQDLATLMMLANQNGGGGNSGGIDPALMMAALGGNIDPNDIWGLGGYA